MNDKQLKRIADAIEEILRLIKKPPIRRLLDQGSSLAKLRPGYSARDYLNLTPDPLPINQCLR